MYIARYIAPRRQIERLVHVPVYSVLAKVVAPTHRMTECDDVMDTNYLMKRLSRRGR